MEKQLVIFELGIENFDIASKEGVVKHHEITKIPQASSESKCIKKSLEEA